ncbi:MAG TPA: hypothetical protein VFQ59_01770 [Candidatus Paceibacterota bacterium]|nr:hypothetical protein [Candidatus Paceibacterota bacterium]
MDKEEKPKIKNVVTLTDEMIKVLESDSSGAIKKIIQEEEHREKVKKNFSPESTRNKVFLALSFFLVGFSVIGLISIFLFREKIIVAPVQPQYNPIIFADKSFFAEVGDLTRKEMAGLISGQVRLTEVKIGGVEAIHLTDSKRVMGFGAFAEKINISLPKEGLAHVQNSFLFGATRTSDEDRNLFILLKVRSFADIFPHMRAWEAKMFLDLHDMFGITLSPENSYLQLKEFEAGMIVNKNARILYDNEGELVLMYIFVDDNSIVIANDIPTAREAMVRLAGSKIRQ